MRSSPPELLKNELTRRLSALISLQPSHPLRRNNKLGHMSYFHMHSWVTSHRDDWQGGQGSVGAACPRTRQHNREPTTLLMPWGTRACAGGRDREMGCPVSQGPKGCICGFRPGLSPGFCGLLCADVSQDRHLPPTTEQAAKSRAASWDCPENEPESIRSSSTKE